MKTSALFQQALSEVPNDLKIQIDLSFAFSDKLAGILEERGMFVYVFSASCSTRTLS